MPWAIPRRQTAGGDREQRPVIPSVGLHERIWIGYILAARVVMTSDKVVATNREAYHNYHILETYECGIALTGTEVKSIREGRCNLKDSYGQIRQGEAWLLNAHISPYSHGNRENHEPTRTRKLLLNRSEIDRLAGKFQEKGLTLVPTKMYLKKGRVKIELAVAKGKKLYDKRETERRREADRETRAMMKERRR
ncbi:MAG TPA: SsrA-binding protein SmpB [Blastocatellia bacterium]|nr:SsrA-binding protein SmpB [Blastocatellia bacterium]